uniref:cobalamin-binding protein n=1 Tax=Ningiella ruwaisensis TaxID=2364274 RepID=UPI001446C9FB|nr:cobalamin-binding protein [Ningiella ruwaisensis]
MCKRWVFFSILICCFVASALEAPEDLKPQKEPQKELHKEIKNQQKRIVSLSPHLTELTFYLGFDAQLVGVSDFSDYPLSAKSLPRVASYQGANIAEILRLDATHVLAWDGGNKATDIAKLQSNQIPVFLSKVTSTDDLLQDIERLGAFLGDTSGVKRQVKRLQDKIESIKARYISSNKSVFYYLNQQPLVALGNDPWLNDLLRLCGLNNVFAHSPSAYPQVSLEQVIRHAPELIIVANKQDQEDFRAFWSEHHKVLDARFIQINPDKMHRFTPRAIDELDSLCQQAYTD